jgi:hypothetical protein
MFVHPWIDLKFRKYHHKGKTSLKLRSISLQITTWGVCRRKVKVIDSKPLAPHRCGFESLQGPRNLLCEEAIQLAYGTSVVLLSSTQFVSEIIHGRLTSSSTSKAETSLYTVSVWRKPQLNKQTQPINKKQWSYDLMKMRSSSVWQKRSLKHVLTGNGVMHINATSVY